MQHPHEQQASQEKGHHVSATAAAETTEAVAAAAAAHAIAPHAMSLPVKGHQVLSSSSTPVRSTTTVLRSAH